LNPKIHRKMDAISYLIVLLHIELILLCEDVGLSKNSLLIYFFFL
ncbi:hypothetical protein CLOP_g3592, partial [Closterium sp. NIES-67]